MAEQIHSEIAICNDQTLPLQRELDAEGFYVHCPGGFRAAMSKKDVWMIEPVMDDRRPCRKGFYTKSELQAFLRKIRLTPIAFQKLGWRNGSYYSHWSPLIPSRTKHFLGPSDLWGNVAANLAKQRSEDKLRSMTAPTRDKVAKLVDDRSDEEWLARSIGLSLQSIDISVEQVADFYHEQLVNIMSYGVIDSRRFGSSQDQTLFAYVHSFFLHLGAARDYLAALIAIRIGKDSTKINSMNRLMDVVRDKDVETDALLKLLEARKLIQPNSTSPNRREISGWLKEASELRNHLVHRRPYGARHVEALGRVTAIAPDIGIYRYVRPILVENDIERDVLDVIVYHYKQATALFQEAAEASGQNISTIAITDDDIISVSFDKSA